MAIQESPEKMLPLSDIYKVGKHRQMIFFFSKVYFSLLLIDFHIIEQIHKNGKIH